jgi:uncharacterized membrane protein
MHITRYLQQTNRFEITLLLFAMTMFCFSLSVVRYVVTDTPVFLFLNWNLFLAVIPWMASSAMIMFRGFRKNKFFLFCLVVIWIAFFPNSPYILTDLFHLRVRNSAPIWFDLVVILSFAWAGLVFGFQSLFDIESLMSERIKPLYVNIVTTCLLFLGAFGVYIGRYLRWNTWDIVDNPFELFSDIGSRILNPFDHWRTWGVTLLMGILLNMIYWTIKLMRRNSSKLSPPLS